MTLLSMLLNHKIIIAIRCFYVIHLLEQSQFLDQVHIKGMKKKKNASKNLHKKSLKEENSQFRQASMILIQLKVDRFLTKLKHVCTKANRHSQRNWRREYIKCK